MNNNSHPENINQAVEQHLSEQQSNETVVDINPFLKTKKEIFLGLLPLGVTVLVILVLSLGFIV